MRRGLSGFRSIKLLYPDEAIHQLNIQYSRVARTGDEQAGNKPRTMWVRDRLIAAIAKYATPLFQHDGRDLGSVLGVMVLGWY